VPPKREITVEEAAKILDLSENRVRELLARGQVPGWKYGQSWYLYKDDAKAFARLEPGRRGRPRKLKPMLPLTDVQPRPIRRH
jgi:excisionase family DNA binding protein